MAKYSFQEQELLRMLHDRTAELTEFSELLEDVFPEFYEKFEEWWEPPQYVQLVGDDRVCTTCGSMIHAGARPHHSMWHKKLTVAIWLLQGGYLHHMVKSGTIKVTDGGVKRSMDFTEPPIPEDKPKKSKKRKKRKKVKP